MAELSKELAKIYLEQKGFLTALDLQMDLEGYESQGFDVLGVEIVRGMVSQAIVGLVRGWWHEGSYLTPGLIRSHLESSRGFLSDYFSAERIEYIRHKFGLGLAPIHNILFYSQRSPGKSEEAARLLSTMGVHVVYLEDVIVDLLPQVGKVALGDGVASQLLPMIRYSRLFREMREAVKQAEACKTDGESEIETKPKSTVSKEDKPTAQMSLLPKLEKQEEPDAE